MAGLDPPPMLKSDEGKRFDTITLSRLDMDCRAGKLAQPA
jgi:hypothetical protein